MSIRISVRRMSISLDMKKMIRETCEKLSGTYDDIQDIEIFIDDVNGPDKGGVDKRCHVKVRGVNHLSLDIVKVSRDIYTAIDLAFSRLVQLLKQEFKSHKFYISVPSLTHIDKRFLRESANDQ